MGSQLQCGFSYIQVHVRCTIVTCSGWWAAFFSDAAGLGRLRSSSATDASDKKVTGAAS